MSTNPFSSQPTPAFSGIPEHERIGFPQRFGAAIIDALASVLFALVLSFLLLQFGVGQTEAFTEMIDKVSSLYDMLGISTDFLEPMHTWLGAYMLATVIAGISYSLIEGLTGASPGKRVLRIHIAQADGSAASTAMLISRWSVKNVTAITAFIALVPTLGFIETLGNFLGFVVFVGLFFIFSTRRQALHDMIAHTAVFHR